MKTTRHTSILRRGLLLAACGLLTGTFNATSAHAAINVVTTTPELADITRQIGGSNVSVYSIAKPDRDYHKVDALPSDVQRVAKAKLLVASGLDLELWLSPLTNAAGNREFMRGGSRYVNASEGIPLLEVPTQQISGASGDIHVEGNPHFWYDPIYGKFIARNITKGLVRIDAPHADAYRANYLAFNREIDRRMVGWKAALAPFAGRPVVTYHLNYDYFLRRFGLRFYGTLEPKPGIPPSAGHINSLIRQMKRDKVRAVVVESIYPTRFADLVAREAGIHYVRAPYSVGAMGTGNYFQMIDRLVNSFKEALSQ